MKFSEQVAENKRIEEEKQKGKYSENVLFAKQEANHMMFEMKRAAHNKAATFFNAVDVHYLDDIQRTELMTFLREKYPDESQFVSMRDIHMIRNGSIASMLGMALIFKY